MSTISVVIYNTSDSRDHCHWALRLDSETNDSVMVQVIEDKEGIGYYMAIYKEPGQLGKLKEMIICGTIATEKVYDAMNKIQNHRIDKQSTKWNCQTWVMENLDDLEIDGLLQIVPRTRATLQLKRQNWQ